MMGEGETESQRNGLDMMIVRPWGVDGLGSLTTKDILISNSYRFFILISEVRPYQMRPIGS